MRAVFGFCSVAKVPGLSRASARGSCGKGTLFPCKVLSHNVGKAESLIRCFPLLNQVHLGQQECVLGQAADLQDLRL